MGGRLILLGLARLGLIILMTNKQQAEADQTEYILAIPSAQFKPIIAGVISQYRWINAGRGDKNLFWYSRGSQSAIIKKIGYDSAGFARFYITDQAGIPYAAIHTQPGFRFATQLVRQLFKLSSDYRAHVFLSDLKTGRIARVPDGINYVHMDIVRFTGPRGALPFRIWSSQIVINELKKGFNSGKLAAPYGAEREPSLPGQRA